MTQNTLKDDELLGKIVNDPSEQTISEVAKALNLKVLPLEDRAFLTRTIEIPDLRSTKRFENEGVGELRRRFVPTKIIGVFQSYLVANGKEFETDDPIYAKCHTIITKDMLQELEAIDKDIYL